MALQPKLTPYLRSLHVAKKNARSFAAAAAAREASAAADGFKPREEVKTSKANGVAVASIETHRPLSKLAVFFR